jgi:hypothetical protein
MNPEIQDKLDARLAGGEITQKEYLEIMATLRSSETSNQPLLVVPEEELVLWADGLAYKQQRFGYDRVINLIFQNRKSTFNFLPTSRLTSVSFDLKEGPHVSVGEVTGILPGKRAPIIRQAYVIIRQATCDRRRDTYLKKLLNDGHFEIGGARLHIGGLVEKDGVSIDLKTAAKEGGLSFGTVQSSGIVFSLSGMTTQHNPFDVLIEAKNPKRRIVFTIPYDYDVIRDVIEILAKPKTP